MDKPSSSSPIGRHGKAKQFPVLEITNPGRVSSSHNNTANEVISTTSTPRSSQSCPTYAPSQNTNVGTSESSNATSAPRSCHREPAYHAPPASGQLYGQPVACVQSPYIAHYSASAQAQVRRKQVRATQACNHCRARKQKCDEARPCQFCRENSFDCQYKDVPPPKQVLAPATKSYTNDLQARQNHDATSRQHEQYI
jgi:hypothetical protein